MGWPYDSFDCLLYFVSVKLVACCCCCMLHVACCMFWSVSPNQFAFSGLWPVNQSVHKWTPVTPSKPLRTILYQTTTKLGQVNLRTTLNGPFSQKSSQFICIAPRHKSADKVQLKCNQSATNVQPKNIQGGIFFSPLPHIWQSHRIYNGP